MTKVIYTKSHFDWLRRAGCVPLHQHRKKLTGTLIGMIHVVGPKDQRVAHVIWNRPHLGIRGLLDQGEHFADHLEPEEAS